MPKSKSEGTPRRITPYGLIAAMNRCAAQRALPKDWDNWFPSTIPIVIKIEGEDITVGDLVRFAIARLLEFEDDDSRFIEAAQVLALIQYLGAPPLDTIVTSIHGK